jgi:hypothetical protein
MTCEITHLSPDVEAQMELERLFNKNQLLPRLRYEFRIDPIVTHCQESNFPVEFAIDLLCQMVLHKRATVSTLVGLLHHHTGKSPEQLQACADLLLKAAEIDLVDYDPLARQFIIKMDVSQDVYDDLARYQYPLPMMIQPKELKSNTDSGYYTHKSSVILRNNHTEDDVCLDHINRVNKIKLVINPDTVKLAKNQWSNLDHPKDGETKEEYTKRLEAFERFDKHAREVLEHVYISGKQFWLTHRYDKRGRTYCQGYSVNYQGNDFQKAVIEFAKQEVAV